MRLAYVGKNVEKSAPTEVVTRIASPVSVAVVDVANVMGARPDGWWRDRAGAALRLGREVIALARRDGRPAGSWVLVLEGQARAAAPVLADEAAPAGVRVVSAPGSGDDAIVGVVAEAVAAAQSCLVVTADRELRQRCEDLNASVVGPGWLLRLL
jgi:hypothetical protein